MTKKTKSAHYVDNEKFYEAMCQWKSEIGKAKVLGLPKPQCPRYIGECFVKISNHLSHKSNFFNYTFKDEMILDAIEQCLRYAHNFNPEKSKNAFSYFTQIAYYAFIRRIKKEARDDDTRMRYLSSIDFWEILEELEGGDESWRLKKIQDWLLEYENDKADLNKVETKSKKPNRRPLYFDSKENDEEAIDNLPQT